MIAKRIFSFFLITIGIVAFILAIQCYNQPVGDHAYSYSYGGDAYTGIQNAAARTANNIMQLGVIIKSGFGHVLMIAALTLWAFGLYGLIGNKRVSENASPISLAGSNPAVPENTVTDNEEPDAQTESPAEATEAAEAEPPMEEDQPETPVNEETEMHDDSPSEALEE